MYTRCASECVYCSKPFDSLEPILLPTSRLGHITYMYSTSFASLP